MEVHVSTPIDTMDATQLILLMLCMKLAWTRTLFQFSIFSFFFTHIVVENRICTRTNEGSTAKLMCPFASQRISLLNFVSYGTAEGNCVTYPSLKILDVL